MRTGATYFKRYAEAETVAIYSDCRYCGAKFGDPCRTASKKPARRPHEMRVRPFLWNRADWPLIIREEPELADIL